jgi:hypothetical protein
VAEAAGVGRVRKENIARALEEVRGLRARMAQRARPPALDDDEPVSQPPTSPAIAV